MRNTTLRFHYPENYAHGEISLSDAGWSYSPEDSHFGVWIREAGWIIHDRNFVNWILSTISDKPLGTIIEVGANIGTHSCAYMAMCNHLICFEPFTTSFECLHRNILKQSIHSDRCSVDAYCAGAGAELSHERFEVEPNHGASHIMMKKVPFLEPTVTCFPLDHFNPQKGVRLIKIDAEGFEPLVLLGAEQLIAHHRPEIVLEVNHGALNRYGYDQETLLRIMRKMEYQVAGVWPLGFDSKNELELLQVPQYDVHFRPK